MSNAVIKTSCEVSDAFTAAQILEHSAGTINDTDIPLRPGECWVLDAPGINGMGGANSMQRMQDYIEAGGKLLHRVRLNSDQTDH